MNQKMLLLSVKIHNAGLSLSVQTGLEFAKVKAMEDLKYIVNSWAVPFMLIAIGIVVLFNIYKLVDHRKQGEDYQDHIKALIICVVAATIVASFPVWGWQMLGISEAA